MANKAVSNVQSLTTGVAALTQKVNELYAAVERVSGVSSKAMTNVQGAISTTGGDMSLGHATVRPGIGTDNARGLPSAGGGGGQTNSMQSSLSGFSWDSRTDGIGGRGDNDRGSSFGGGAFKLAMALPAGAYAATPDLSLTMARSVGYYQAALKSPGLSRGQLERNTMRAMGGGLSSVGSDAAVAAMLAGRGYTPGSKNYLQASAEAGGAYKYLGMDNAAAASAISGFQTGPMGANLYQYGIETYDPRTGKDKTTGQLARQLMNVMGGSGATPEQVRQSKQRGALGANLATMGFDAAQQEMLYQAMLDISSGRDPDLRKAKPGQGNANTMLTAAGRMNTSQTGLMTKAEDSMIKGFENAADTVEAFNRALLNVVEPLGYLKGVIGGVGGTNLGAGIATTGALASSGISNMAGSSKGGALWSAIKAFFRGGATSGYGAGFGSNLGPRGGGAPVSGAVSAGYGAKDNSGIWSASNNKHTGTDYAVPIGTPVTATMVGTVSSTDAGPDYGTSIIIDSANGYQTVYGHLSSRNVTVGQTIMPGQVIGKSGDSGNTTGPHLHYEVRKGSNNPIDPSQLPAQYGGMSPISLTGTAAERNSSAAGASSGASSPYRGGKDSLSNEALRSVLTGAGFTGDLTNAMNVVRQESGGRPGALNPDGEYSMGIFQVNMSGGMGDRRNANYLKKYAEYGYTGRESLYDPAINARIAYDISLGGTKWSDAWVNTSKKLGLGGGTSGYGASIPAPSVGGSKTVHITVKFDEANERSAKAFAKQVQSYLDERNNNSMIGSS